MRTDLEKEIKSISLQLAKELKTAFQVIMKQKKINENSDVYKSVEIRIANNVFQLWANDYLKFIDSGRPKHTSRKIPVEQLIKFLKRTSIRRSTHASSLIDMAYFMQSSIQKHGIKAKNIFVLMEKTGIDIIEKTINEQFVSIIEQDIANSFKSI